MDPPLLMSNFSHFSDRLSSKHCRDTPQGICYKVRCFVFKDEWKLFAPMLALCLYSQQIMQSSAMALGRSCTLSVIRKRELWMCY